MLRAHGSSRENFNVAILTIRFFMRIHAASLHLMEKFYYEIYFLGRGPSKVVREEHHRTIRDFCSEFLSHNWEREYARGRLGADCQFLPHEISSSGVSSSCKKLTGGDACAIVYNTPSSTRYFCTREHDLHVDTYCITRRKQNWIEKVRFLIYTRKICGKTFFSFSFDW